MQIVSASDIREAMDWESAIQALSIGHRGARPQVQDLLLSEGAFSLFGRGVILAGHGAGMKIASIFPPNVTRPVPAPMEDSVFAVIDEDSKKITAILDGPELTCWKTAADSALGSRLLSNEDSEVLLVIGAGPIACALAQAHLHVRPSISKVRLWNRTPDRQDRLASLMRATNRDVKVVSDLTDAIKQADIITTATGATAPIIMGEHLKPSCHLDLVGSFTPEMREADNSAIERASVFVDNKATTVEHAGDICQPIAQGIMTSEDIKGDLFDLMQMVFKRRPEEITVFKNAGGAHIDLLVASAVLTRIT